MNVPMIHTHTQTRNVRLHVQIESLHDDFIVRNHLRIELLKFARRFLLLFYFIIIKWKRVYLVCLFVQFDLTHRSKMALRTQKAFAQSSQVLHSHFIVLLIVHLASDRLDYKRFGLVFAENCLLNFIVVELTRIRRTIGLHTYRYQLCDLIVALNFRSIVTFWGIYSCRSLSLSLSTHFV